jgi:adenosylcobinamide kinase / adenosylcobinamide-phosphate guanylyltransferase
MKSATTLVMGGCKSGKSSYALELANGIAADESRPGRKIFLATSVPTDSEMEERVEAHKKERGENWQTFEEPVAIAQAIKENSIKADVILVDCLTLWISNLLYKDYDKANIFKEVQKLVESVDSAECPVVLVSNEVGAGIVPENKLARVFRDIAGLTNQEIAKAVKNVVWTIAGIPVNIKN